MITRDIYKALAISFAAILLLSFSLAGKPIDSKPPRSDQNSGSGGPEKTPLAVTVDQVIHDNGNVSTTVDNWGYIGGYQFLSRPSGEWPRNSGHDYIGEIRYWMGAIDGVDTLVANSYDDFQALPSLISSVQEHKIYLSTDTTRYFNYDPADTIGLGEGNPASGWKIWNADSGTWVYEQNYNPRDSTFFLGGPISLQESHYRFNDAAQGSSLMGLEITHTVLQWNYCYNEDFMFVIMEITNTSTVDYTNFAFGLYVDLDVGGPDGSGENGRLGDLVAYDSAANLAWNYEQDGYDEGWGGQTGIMGTKYLETPDSIGMTGFRTGLWAQVPTTDAGMFKFLDSTGFDPGLPPDDQYYIQATRGINLLAGKTVRVVYAIIAGADSTDFRNNADLAQNLYDNIYVGPQPPITPALTAVASDRQIFLSWNDTSETSIDPLSGTTDFAGYKLYRSEDRGLTWGAVDESNSNTCLTIDYERIAEYTVTVPGSPISHSFVDTGLYNDVEYWYALAAIDSGASATGVQPLQTGFGTAGKAANIVTATPRADPAGFFEAAGTVDHIYTGSQKPSVGSVMPIAFDYSIMQGSNYKVVFEDTPDTTFWHLINTTTGDTVLANQTRTTGDPGMYDIVQGIRVVVRDGTKLPRSMTQTAFGGTDTTLSVPDNYLIAIASEFYTSNTYGHKPIRSTFELRYTGTNTLISAFNDTSNLGLAWTFPFEVWNTTSNQQVTAAIFDIGLNGAFDPWDAIMLIDEPYSPTVDPFTTNAWPKKFSWFFQFDNSYNPVVGDVFTFEGAPLNGPDDEFSFAASGVNPAQASADLDKIMVVPNPYLARNWARVETNTYESKLTFRNVPSQCTIRIYTLAGDLVQTIEHNDPGGTAEWNLLSSNNQQIASGVYIYHVESPVGEHLGRFAVVK